MMMPFKGRYGIWVYPRNPQPSTHDIGGGTGTRILQAGMALLSGLYRFQVFKMVVPFLEPSIIRCGMITWDTPTNGHDFDNAPSIDEVGVPRVQNGMCWG